MRATILLFDVDGTLVRTGGAGRRAMEGALADAGSNGSASFSFAGMTDRAIVRLALGSRGHPVAEEEITAVLDRYLVRLASEVAQARADDYRVCEGVIAALEAADRTPRCAVGLGTGNIEPGARIKLGRVGLADRFRFGGYGSDAEPREELRAIGAERGAELLGVARASCRVVVIGDTPKDVAAARAIGAECVAVGTGPVPFDDLVAAAPDHLFANLEAPGAIGALLGRDRSG
jgi:phosphoglycolate phosphatase-like HAD superfamily hydrolase